MLMFPFNEIPSTCQLLLLFLVGMVLLFLSATRWTIQTMKEFQAPCSKKKWKKYLAPCLTSLERSGNKDPERSSEDLNLEYTLRTLDWNIQYLAWQMKRISGPTALLSASSTTVETVLCSGIHSSAGSQSRKPSSLMPADLGREVQSWQPQHLTTSTGAGPEQVCVEALSHRKVDFHIQRKEEQEGAAPWSGSLTRLIPLAPKPHPAAQRTDSPTQVGASRIIFLSYKEQELLNWHIQRKHQQTGVAPLHLTPVTTRARMDSDRTQTGGLMHWVPQQPPAAQRPRGHTPPQSSIPGRRTPPKTLCVPSPGPSPRLLIPPPEDLPPPPVLICKGASHSSIHESVEIKLRSGTPKAELAEMLTMLRQSKSPMLGDSGRPGTPKEKEKGSPTTPKEDLGRVGRVGSPIDKQVEVKINSRTDQIMHTLSWMNMPEIQRPSQTQEQPAPAIPKFLDPSFMCQNQLELPCIATTQGEQNQKSYTLLPPARTPKPLCLAHTILQSLDTEQAMRDLQMHLAKGLEMEHNLPSVEYPICLLCGRCTPYCPHPRTRHSPCLLVYPRLDVQDGEAHMTLGFLLKIKRSEADEWGLTPGMDVHKTCLSKEHISKGEKSRRSTPHRKSKAHASRFQEPKTPDRTPRVAKRLFSESGDQKTRSRTVSPKTADGSPRVARRLFSESGDQKTRSRVVSPKTPDRSPRVVRQLFPKSSDQKTRSRVVTPKTPDRSSRVARQLFPETSDQKSRSRVVTPKSPDRSPHVVRKLFPESGDQKTTSQVVTPKTPDRTPRVVRQFFPDSGDQKTRNWVDNPQVFSSTPKPTTPQSPKTQQSPKSQFHKTLSRRTPSTPRQVHPKPLDAPPSILKQMVSSIKRAWTRMRQEADKCSEMCSEMCSTKKGSRKSTKKSGAVLYAPEPRKEPQALSIAPPTYVSQMKGESLKSREASPLFTSKQEATPLKATPQTPKTVRTPIIDQASKQEASPLKLATPRTPKTMGTPIISQASTVRYTPPRDHKSQSLHFEEPDSPWVFKKANSSHKKSASPKTPKRSPASPRTPKGSPASPRTPKRSPASPRTPKRSPSLLRRTPSRQSTPKVSSHWDSD